MMSIGISTMALRTTFLEAMVDFLALFRERAISSMMSGKGYMRLTRMCLKRNQSFIIQLWLDWEKEIAENITLHQNNLTTSERARPMKPLKLQDTLPSSYQTSFWNDDPRQRWQLFIKDALCRHLSKRSSSRKKNLVNSGIKRFETQRIFLLLISEKNFEASNGSRRTNRFLVKDTAEGLGSHLGGRVYHVRQDLESYA